MIQIHCEQFIERVNKLNESLTKLNDSFNERLNENGEEQENMKTIERYETEFMKTEIQLNTLNAVLENEDEFNQFFSKCKEMKKMLNRKCNETITTIVREQKKEFNREEFLNSRNEWNKKRMIHTKKVLLQKCDSTFFVQAAR